MKNKSNETELVQKRLKIKSRPVKKKSTINQLSGLPEMIHNREKQSKTKS